MRVTVNELGSPVGYDDYYPFGSVMDGRSNNSGNSNDLYKFTGKERDTEASLNLDYFGARYYDAALGRWLSVDPAEEYPSPYTYVGNNPLNLIDPTGMHSVKYTGEAAREFFISLRNQSEECPECDEIQRIQSNREHPDPEKPEKKNYHELGDQERIDHILSYLYYLNQIDAEGGSFREIFDFNKSGVELGPLAGLYSRPSINGYVSLGGSKNPIEIQFGFAGSYLQKSGIIASTSFVFETAHLIQNRGIIDKRTGKTKVEGFYAVAYNKVRGYDKPLSFLVGFNDAHLLKLFTDKFVPYPKLIMDQ